MTLHCEGDGRRTVVFTRPVVCENSSRGYAASIRGASDRRALGLLRHMLNWAVGREYLDRTPFRRGTEVLIRMELEDNKRRRRISESEEAALLAVASPHLQSMIIAARGHWHAPRRDAGGCDSATSTGFNHPRPLWRAAIASAAAQTQRLTRTSSNARKPKRAALRRIR